MADGVQTVRSASPLLSSIQIAVEDGFGRTARRAPSYGIAQRMRCESKTLSGLPALRRRTANDAHAFVSRSSKRTGQRALVAMNEHQSSSPSTTSTTMVPRIAERLGVAPGCALTSSDEDSHRTSNCFAGTAMARRVRTECALTSATARRRDDC
jgi:hypothetical protein